MHPAHPDFHRLTREIRFKSPKTLFGEDPAKNTFFPKSPKKPKAPPPVPTPDDPEVEAARKREREEARRRKSRSATILTSELGDPSEPTVQRKTLLGG